MRNRPDISERKAADVIWIGTAVFLIGVMFRSLAHERPAMPGPLHD
jgi:hypothetical protein